MLAPETDIILHKKWYSIFSETGLPANSFNFINSIIGSGVVGIPFVFAQTGIPVSLVLFLLIFLLADYSLLILISCGNKVGAKSYQELVKIVLGKWGFAVLSLLQFSYPFISLISYNIIIGDTITKVAIRLFNVSPYSIVANRIFIISIVSVFVTIPLCMFEKFSKLTKVSFLSCVLLLFVLSAMIVRMVTQKNKLYLKRLFLEILIAFLISFVFSSVIDFSNIYSSQTNILAVSNSFSILAFAFMTQHNSFLIYFSLKNPSFSKWKKLTHVSVFGSILFSILFGLIGYLSFGALTQADITESYCIRDDLFNVARLAYALIIIFSFPLEGTVCREVLKNLFERFGHPKLFHYGIATVVVIASVLLSFISSCLDIVLEINGSITATSMAYIIPPLCLIVIQYRTEKVRKVWPYIIPTIMILIGVYFIVSGVVSIVQQLVAGYSCSNTLEPVYCKAIYGNHLEGLINGKNTE